MAQSESITSTCEAYASSNCSAVAAKPAITLRKGHSGQHVYIGVHIYMCWRGRSPKHGIWLKGFIPGNAAFRCSMESLLPAGSALNHPRAVSRSRRGNKARACPQIGFCRWHSGSWNPTIGRHCRCHPQRRMERIVVPPFQIQNRLYRPFSRKIGQILWDVAVNNKLYAIQPSLGLWPGSRHNTRREEVVFDSWQEFAWDTRILHIVTC